MRHIVAVIFALSAPLAAQNPPAAPRFEVVSVKLSNADVARGALTAVGGRFTASSVTLRELVAIAYDFSDRRIDGGPEWQTSRRFDIQAKAADPVAGIEAMQPMLQALLADRFHLKVHTESREMPIYALTVAREDGRLGSGVRPSAADCSKAEQDASEARAKDSDALTKLLADKAVPCAIMPAPTRIAGSMTMHANAATMADLARLLSAATGRTVRDRTGLSGRYNWELTFDRAVRPQTTPQPGANLPLETPAVSDNPSLTTALQEQLGLKLESTRGAVEFLVIDSAALPERD